METEKVKKGRGCNCAERLQDIVGNVGKNTALIQDLAKKHSLCFQRTSDRFIGYLVKERIVPPLDIDCDCEAAIAINKIHWILLNPKTSNLKDECIDGKKERVVFPMLPAIKERMGKIKALFY